MDQKLAMKIYNMMCDTEAIEKNTQVGKKTDSFSYKAIGEADVLNMVKPLLKKYKVIVLPIEVTAIQINKITQLTAKFKIVDAETGESEILAAPGNGADSQDKGSGKAWTYLYKAMFQKTLCLFSGEDTDNTHSNDITEKIKEDESKVTTAMLLGAIEKSDKDIDYVLGHYNEAEKKGITDIKFISQERKQYYYKKLGGK